VRVEIDGVEYAPLGPRGIPRIGIGVTTRNPDENRLATIREIIRLAPGKVVLVDDASTTPPEIEGVATFRFEENVGIARAKNKCLELLADVYDCEHIFLWDDDAYPLVDDWWKPYVESPEPHLMRIFEDLSGPSKLHDIKRIYRDEKHVAYTGPRGMMLYVDRKVLDVVGGMDVGYGKWGYEHGDWSGRIHNAGLTTWRFADVANGGELIYSLDEHEQVHRGISDKAERMALVKENVKRYQANWHSTAYHEYREQRNVVLTCLYSAVDPQRPKAAKLTLQAAQGLIDSMERLDFHNWLVMTGPLGVANLYVQRWIDYYTFLRDHPEVEYVWCVDATDVEMLKLPFPEMHPGYLYVGTEPSQVGIPWMTKNQSKDMQWLLQEHGSGQLFNAGLVGGDRKTMLELCHKMVKLYFDNQTDVFHKKNTDITEGVNDMGMLNVLVYDRGENIRWGAQINTVFKSNGVGREYAWWKHK
jgi:glycosyltransferase involved in cell wall biosynthesis